MLPAQFAARSVDVIAEPVYLYRIREGIDVSDQSITQRRLDRQVLLDRIAAVEHVLDHLGREGPRKARRWYEQSVVADDLMLLPERARQRGRANTAPRSWTA